MACFVAAGAPASLSAQSRPAPPDSAAEPLPAPSENAPSALGSNSSGAGSRAATGESDARSADRAATYFIREYRVKGAKQLPVIEIESAVYPFLGPARTERDIEAARASLEKAYQEKGFQTVAVQVPQQQVKGGVVYLQVVERTVGRVRVKGAKYFSPSKIKAGAPSLAEGKVIDFNDVPRDIVALNQLPDRQVTPTLQPGATPDTVDVDLEVKDKRPLHASLELNNRQGPDTKPLRLNGSVSSSNFLQLGHSLGFNFQIAPQDLEQVKVFSGYYLVRSAQWENFSFLLQGTSQNSNVSTLGSVAVAGRGETFGIRGIFNLPGHEGFAHSLSTGLDYKGNRQRIRLGTTTSSSEDILAPVTYYPFSLNYTGNWMGKQASTELNLGLNFHVRGMGSSAAEFNNRRFGSDGSFLYLRGDLSHTLTLPAQFQLYGKVQGQLSNQPLLDPEQFTGGGLGTVRGYMEGEAAGDNGLAGTLELRSPSLLPWIGFEKSGEWRIYTFGDGAWLTVEEALPGQKDHYYLASWGVGTRIQFSEHFSGSLDAGRAVYQQNKTQEGTWRLTFRAGVEF